VHNRDSSKPVKVATGTRNPAKLRGIERAFRECFGEVEITGIAIDSGVSRQPFSLEETLNGALNRAARAFEVVRGDYGVGVEAGIFSLADARIEVQVAAVVSASGKVGIGLSPAFPLPPRFVEALEKGEVSELEEAVDRAFGRRSVGEAEGLVGLLTGGKVTREELTRLAVMMALVPFLNPQLFNLTAEVSGQTGGCPSHPVKAAHAEKRAPSP
jgi:inosine/xanthosine triphosphatase